jgi:hypothetical protein
MIACTFLCQVGQAAIAGVPRLCVRFAQTLCMAATRTAGKQLQLQFELHNTPVSICMPLLVNRVGQAEPACRLHLAVWCTRLCVHVAQTLYTQQLATGQQTTALRYECRRRETKQPEQCAVTDHQAGLAQLTASCKNPMHAALSKRP